jgi:colanic acid biosynthesis glycosyl transferase WcaI
MSAGPCFAHAAGVRARAPGSGGVLLVEQYFYPEGWGGAEIPREVAAAIRGAGIEITVVCGTEQYLPADAAPGVPHPGDSGVKILRVPRLLPGSNRSRRALRALGFSICAFAMLAARRGLRLIITQTNPPLVVPAIALAAAIRRVPFIIIAQDLYPEVLFASNLLDIGSWRGRALNALFGWGYRRAHKVIVLGQCMAQRVRAKGVPPERITTISNWATGQPAVRAADNPLRARWNLQDRFVVLYSGNLGIGHEFDTLLDGVRVAAQSTPQLQLVLIGGGARYEEVRRRTRALGMEDRVRFFDFVSADELNWSIGLADLAVVTLRTGFEGIIVPSKFFGYMARAVPTLYIGPDDDIAAIIRRADCGAVCGPNDSAQVAKVLSTAAADPALRCRWGDNARRAYEQQFRRDLALERYVGVVEEALGNSRR